MMNLDLGDTQLIIEECEENNCTKKQTAYILATAYWETGRSMKPVKETVMPHHNDKNPTDAQVISRMDNWAKKIGRTSNLYWRQGWFGRGYVQLTHKENYERARRELGVDLVGNPDLAMRPDIAAKILVRGMVKGWFTGAKLDASPDYVASRRVVNGNNKDQEIADIAVQYEAALHDAPAKKKGFLEWLLDIFARFR